MKSYLVFAVITLSLVHISESARILSVVPTPSKSHFASAKAIIKELVRRGHEVVSISPHDVEDQGTNYTWVPIEVQGFQDSVPNFKELMNAKHTIIGNQLRLWKIMTAYTDHISKLPKLKKFIEEDKSKFDLILAEEFLTEFLLVFSYKYSAPFVMISTFGSGHYINQYMGNSYELAYVPHEFIDLYGDLSFVDRAYNLFCTVFDLVFKRYYSLNFQKELARRAFKDLPDAPDVEDIRANVSVMFLNSYFTLSVVRPFLPNIIEVGGIHIEEVKPLEKNLDSIIRESTKGVILFSFGSILDLSIQDPDITSKILRALGRLEETVLLRWASDKPMPIKSKNVHGLKWLPQNDILAHPNTKAFVTHGGLLSSQEAIYHGVPTICIPFYGDQPLNCRKSVLIGFGLSLDLQTLDEDTLYRTIKELIGNPKYGIKAKELSLRFKDRPNSAKDTAMYWMDYVMRHKGAEFIKSPKRKLYWFQTLFLDVFAAVIIFLFVTLKVIAAFFKLAFKKQPKVKRS